MKWAFLLSGILEIIGGLLCYFYPEVIFSQLHILTSIFGIAIVVLGIINIFCYRHYNENQFFRTVYISMMGYHAIVAMTCHGLHQGDWQYAKQAAYTHLVLFIIFIFFYLKDVKPDTPA